MRHTSFGIGDERQIHFWNDVWMVNAFLGVPFPNLFSLVVDVMVAGYVVIDAELIYWQASFQIQFQDWDWRSWVSFWWCWRSFGNIFFIAWIPYVGGP